MAHEGAHREHAHDLGEAGGLPAAHRAAQVGEEVGRQLLEGLALRCAELLHNEAVVARLGEEAVALAPARLPPAAGKPLSMRSSAPSLRQLLCRRNSCLATC